MLDRELEAKQDFETALELVYVIDNEELKATIEEALKPLEHLDSL